LKDIVQGVYADRMRQLILQQMKAGGEDRRQPGAEVNSCRRRAGA